MSSEDNKVQTPEIERDGTAPQQQADAIPEMVDFVGLVSDEFGIARSVARRDLLMGKVLIDGEPVEQDRRLDAPREEVAGKTLEVQGGDTSRTYRLQIAE